MRGRVWTDGKSSGRDPDPDRDVLSFYPRLREETLDVSLMIYNGGKGRVERRKRSSNLNTSKNSL